MSVHRDLKRSFAKQFTTRAWLLAIAWFACGLVVGQSLYRIGFPYIACIVVVSGIVGCIWNMGLGTHVSSTAALIGFFLITPIGHEHVRGALVVLMWISITISEYGRVLSFALLMLPGLTFALSELACPVRTWQRTIGYSTVAWFVAVWLWLWMQSDIPLAENLASIPFLVACVVKAYVIERGKQRTQTDNNSGLMMDDEFNDSLDRFMQIIVATLRKGTTTEYFPTVFVIDDSGDISIDQMSSLWDVDSVREAEQLAMAFGEALADEHEAFAALFVACEWKTGSEQEQIAISGTTDDGRTNAGGILFARQHDGTMNVVDVWRTHSTDVNDDSIPIRLATQVYQGFRGRKA